MSNWISVKDKLPEDELETVLVFSADEEGGWYKQFVAWPGYDEDGHYWIMDQPMVDCEGRDIRIPFVTHWKSLGADPT